MTSAESIVAIARKILAGEMGLIEGTRELVRLRSDVSDDLDPDFMYFVALESETDHLPIGSVRAEWAPEALREKDAEIRAYEAAERDDAVRHCEKLIRRFSQDPEGVRA